MLNFTSNNVISSLINVGADNTSNLFYLEFIDDYTSNDTDLANSIKVRVSNFTPPTFSQQTYTTNFMTVDETFPAAFVNGTKQLTFSFRLDKNYDLSKYLLSQQAKTTVTNLGFATNVIPDPADSGLTIKVYG